MSIPDSNPCLSTGLYTELGLAVLLEAWHNTWVNHSSHPFANQVADIYRKNDGEVIVKISMRYAHRQSTSSGLKIDPHAANAVKFLILDRFRSRFCTQVDLKDRPGTLTAEDVDIPFNSRDSYGRRTPRSEDSRRSIKTSVAKLNCIYELLHGASRAQLAERYGEETVREVAGVPNDPFVTQSIDMLEKEISRLSQEEFDEKHEMNRMKTSALQALIKKRDARCSELSAEYNKKLAEIDKEFEAIRPKIVGEWNEKIDRMITEKEAAIEKIRAQIDALGGDAGAMS